MCPEIPLKHLRRYWTVNGTLPFPFLPFSGHLVFVQLEVISNCTKTKCHEENPLKASVISGGSVDHPVVFRMKYRYV